MNMPLEIVIACSLALAFVAGAAAVALLLALWTPEKDASY